jgi:hypothetical protein
VEEAGVEIDIAPLHCDRLADAKACLRDEGNERPVRLGNLCDQTRELFRRKSTLLDGVAQVFFERVGLCDAHAGRGIRSD